MGTALLPFLFYFCSCFLPFGNVEYCQISDNSNGGSGMIIEVKETTYKGFKIELVENSGWKIVLGDDAYLFPRLQAAQSAVDDFYREVIPKYKGKRMKRC